MEIRLKLRKIGNSMVVSIPSQVVQDLGLKAGDEMLLDLEGTTIKIRKRERGSR
jgi:putative addiction module antidote